LILAAFGAQELMAKSDGRRIPRPGVSLHFAFDLDYLHVFDAGSGRALT
jgi:hypothetical protein